MHRAYLLLATSLCSCDGGTPSGGQALGAADAGSAGGAAPSGIIANEPVLAACPDSVLQAAGSFSFRCGRCVANTGRCVDADEDLATELDSAACSAPECETPLLPGVVNESELQFEYCATFSGPAYGLRGTCADGKRFMANVGPTLGGATYYGDTGAVLGRAEYSAMIGKCECSGESWSGDVLCDSPVYEAMCTASPPIVPLLPATLSLPFAAGRRTAPCLCRD
jgi:hypothetical protein